ncbi:hypothetical protein [Aneurinibacillus tyrosinisolvens]|uniref:hypothetical protein n=1 Tax=Aneurinibacillus tyrosinisolvens TaxID=1443435 RepID=UPI00063FBA04|nr:hypothetical protein [Aneurinibacillus tyrosinisolvens]
MRVFIDMGHGGNDPGAEGNGVGYAAARELGRVIGATVEGVGETRTVRFQLPGQSEPGAQATAEP